VALGVGHGTLTLDHIEDVIISGNGTGLVTLSGNIAAVDAALDSLDYRGLLNYSGPDALSIMVSDGDLSTPGSVAITVRSSAQEAASLQAQITDLYANGRLSQGLANSLKAKLDLKGNIGDTGKVQAFLNQVSDLVLQGILHQDEADELLRLGNILLLSVKRR
jgi:hypothetical protein